MDVLWFRLRKEASDPGETMGRFMAGRIVVLINRGEYWQCAFVIPKGGFEEMRRAGLPAFRDEVARLVPMFADRVDELADWEQIKLLTVAVNRLDAVAPAGAPLHRRCRACDVPDRRRRHQSGGAGRGRRSQYSLAAAREPRHCNEDDLARVQERRMFPTRVTQRMQIIIQNNVIGRLLASPSAPLQAPLLLRLYIAMRAAAPFARPLRRARRAARARAHPGRPRCASGGLRHRSAPLSPEIFRLELDRDAVWRAAGGVVPGIAIARERRRIGRRSFRQQDAPAR